MVLGEGGFAGGRDAPVQGDGVERLELGNWVEKDFGERLIEKTVEFRNIFILFFNFGTYKRRPGSEPSGSRCSDRPLSGSCWSREL